MTKIRRMLPRFIRDPFWYGIMHPTQLSSRRGRWICTLCGKEKRRRHFRHRRFRSRPSDICIVCEDSVKEV